MPIHVPRIPLAWARGFPARIVRTALHRIIYWVLVVLVGRPTITGQDQLALLSPPVVIAANHSSHLDTAFLLNALPWNHRMRTLVVAADYFYTDRLRAMLVSFGVGTIPVDRDDTSTESIERMHRLLTEGWNLALYPEGTRSRDGRMGELHTGAAIMAQAQEVPIVPIGLQGTHASLPPGARWPRRSHIQVRIGAPLFPEPKLDEEAEPDELTNRLESALRTLSQQS